MYTNHDFQVLVNRDAFVDWLYPQDPHHDHTQYATMALMLVKLNQKQKDELAPKLMEWGNLVFVGLTIAQFVPGPFNTQSALFILYGYFVWITAYIAALLLLRR